MPNTMQSEKPVIAPLLWDSEHFGIRCGKAVLRVPLPETLAGQLNAELGDYDFVTFQNVGNEVEVNRFLAQHTEAYLVDVNIQLEKEVDRAVPSAACCPIVPARALDAGVLSQMTVEESEFAYSKFVCDPEMKKRAGYQVYACWLKNAKDDPDKRFIYRTIDGTVAGFILFRVREQILTSELVKVNAACQGRGVASGLLRELEAYAAAQGCRTMQVGTQMNNIPAINLYHRLGYREVSRTSVYHLWRGEDR